VWGPPALRYFALDGTGHVTHHAQAKLIRRCIIWRTTTRDHLAYNDACYERLRRVADRANAA
jgi:hypothetical protein